MRKIFTILFLLIATCSSFAQSNNYADFLPLQVGNKWVYTRTHFSSSAGYKVFYTTSEVVRDTTLNGKQYFLIRNIFGDSASAFVRIDTSGILYSYNVSAAACDFESPLVNFATMPNDPPSPDPCKVSSYNLYSAFDTTFFNIPSTYKSYGYVTEFNGRQNSYNRGFYKDIGLWWDNWSYSGPTGISRSSILRGCIIDGRVLGDTSTVEAKELFPLHVGNVWIYKLTLETVKGPVVENISSTISRDSIINGMKYYYVKNFEGQRGQNIWVRYDESTKFLVQYVENSGCSATNLYILEYAVINDHTNSCSMRKYISNMSYYHSNPLRNSILKEYRTPGSGNPDRLNASLLAGIGIYYFKKDPPGADNNVTAELQSCYINGRHYGNTKTPPSSDNSFSDGQVSLKLQGNYPNPFNPSTKIRFEIPATSLLKNVKLSVFNSVGQEVAVLVDKELQSGTYEFVFDGSNLSSGIYFYKLEAGDFVETKRMVLVK